MRKFLTAPYWIHLLVDTIISQAIWWVISMIFETPILIRSIIAGVILIAGMFCVAWYLPKLTPQSTVADTKRNNKPTPKAPSRLPHDNVLWEDGGQYYQSDNIDVKGPLCPKDFASLMMISNSGGKAEPLKWDRVISKDTYHNYQLYCPECKNKYVLGDTAKTVNESEDEVNRRFQGMRRRGSNEASL